jgi:O-antigen/teichoic acid export membrane protein
MEQGFVSVLNLGANLLLIRRLDPAGYGLFVLTTNAAMIFSNLQGATTIAHLVALPPGAATRPEREHPERMILMMTLAMVGLAGLGCAVAWALFDRDTVLVPAALALYLPALILNNYTRSLAFSRGEVATGTLQSGAVLLIAALLAGAVYLLHIAIQIDVALLILAAAYVGAGIPTLLVLCRTIFGRLRLRDMLLFRNYARETAWVLVGVGSIEMLGRFNSVIVSVWFGTAAVGTLAAAQLLLKPIGLLISAWGWIGRVRMVERREAQDWSGFVTSLIVSAIGSLAITVPWVAAVYFAWPVISAHLFHGLYADDGWIVILSGMSAIVGAVLAVLSLGFQSLRRFRLLAYTDLAGALVSVVATMLLLRFGFEMGLVGMMTGQVLDIVLLTIALFRLLPSSRVLKVAL